MYSKIALSIGGSDSGGGAGIQADLRTFMALNVHGCSAITCITAQNSLEVNCVEAVKKDTLISQIDTLFSDFNINALKTGMLLNESIINDTAFKLKSYSIPKIIDPVMVTRTGSKLLEDSAISAYKKLLLPIADIVTPNIFEANLLSNLDIKNEEDLENSAKSIIKLGAKAVLIKGGGACHVREKLVASKADQLLIVVDETKLVQNLNQSFPLPVEVLPNAWKQVQEVISEMNGSSSLRMATKKAGPVVTDQGNLILDVLFNNGIKNPKEIEMKINNIPGVLENGLFVDLTDKVLVGKIENNTPVVYSPSRAS